MRLDTWNGQPLEPENHIWVCCGYEVGVERPRGFRWVGEPDDGKLIVVLSELTEVEIDARIVGLQGAFSRLVPETLKAHELGLSRKLTEVLAFRARYGRKRPRKKSGRPRKLRVKALPQIVEPTPELTSEPLARQGADPHIRAPVTVAPFVIVPSLAWQVRQEFLWVNRLRSTSLLHGWRRRFPVFPPGDDRGGR